MPNNVEKTLTNKVANKVEYYSVKSVVDGDTILLTSGKEVRFLGIDTPETHHPSSGLECYGKEATDYSATLLEGKKVRLISDVTDKDGYGRLLRYVFTDNGVFVNYELVANGYAQVLDIPPDTLFAKTFTEAQQGAVKNKIGLWGSCIKNKEVQ